MPGTFASSTWSNLEKLSEAGQDAVTGQATIDSEPTPEASYSTNNTRTKSWTSRRLWIKNAALLATSLAAASLTGSLNAATALPQGNATDKSVQQEWHKLKSKRDNGLTEISNRLGINSPDLLLPEAFSRSSGSELLTLPQTGTTAVLIAAQMRNNGSILAGYPRGSLYSGITEVQTTMQEDVSTRKPKYPVPLMTEYKALVRKKSQDGLSVRDNRRLAELMAQINVIDRADPLTQQSVESIKQVRKGLTDIRKALENGIFVKSD